MITVFVECSHCRGPLTGKRRSAAFCSGRCRSRAQRRRAAGLDEAAYNGADGARRGHVRLAESTRRERELRALGLGLRLHRVP